MEEEDELIVDDGNLLDDETGEPEIETEEEEESY